MNKKKSINGYRIANNINDPEFPQKNFNDLDFFLK